MSSVLEYNKSNNAEFSARAKVSSSAVSIAAILCVIHAPNIAAQQATEGQTTTPAQVTQPQETLSQDTPAQGTPAQGAPKSKANQSQLPPIQVRAKRNQPKRQQAARAVPQPAAEPEPTWTGALQTGSAGTVGYLATRTSSATKTDTPLINVPQSVTVLTKDFIKDQSFQGFTEYLRYAPGVIPHQGEFNRDQVVIRGQSSSADFYVNGIRDDVQYFRDLYNIYRVEVLKGPNAMIFGRGGAGGVINRVLKEADGVRTRELVVQGGSFNDRRTTVDIGDAINEIWAARFNAIYENTDSYRKFVNIERYGVNPTAVYKPNDATKVALSYEYFHDARVADRGIPSQGGTALPLRPYLTDPSTFFGNPLLNHAQVDAHIGMAVIEHQFDSGLQIKNSSRYASYDKFYQNIFPGGAVNAAGTSVNLSAYNNETDRRNLFNQTDVTYKFDTGGVKHTFLAGMELGDQRGLSFRQDGFFNNATQTIAVNPLNPVSFVPVTFRNIATGANNTYKLDLAAIYVQDQIELSKHVQFIGGARYDRFDLESTDRRTNVTLERIDKLVSPRAGLVLKPVENVSFYGNYSVSYLPSSGDQFSTLSPGTAIAQPEKLVNREVGVKWDVTPKLMFTSAYYDLDRTNQRLADPNNPGFFILSGATNAKGVEVGLTGYLTDLWQVSGGYAYTDARIVSRTSATILAGNRVGLVPYNVFTLWNKYQFTETWAAGIGIIYQGNSFASSDDTVLLPGFTRVDAGIHGKVDPKYLPPEIRRLRWQVNVENLFDRRYYSMADGNNNITPGSPRAVRGSLTANF